MAGSDRKRPAAPASIPSPVSSGAGVFNVLPSLARGLITVAMGVVGLWLAVVTILEDVEIATAYVPAADYVRFVRGLGGTIVLANGQVVGASLSPVVSLLGCGLSGATSWLAGGWLISRRRRLALVDALAAWGSAGWPWWLAPGGWALALLFSIGGPSVAVYLKATSEFALAIGFSGWLATFAWLVAAPTGHPAPTDAGPMSERRASRIVLIAMATYVIIFTAMNWGLWFNLRIPHGDSAMYEEHLWNLEHGKGFRSYLDPGLFLGEHIQVIHLALLPLHLLWPSHLLMEFCQSIALASGAWFIYRMTQRQTGSPKAAAGLAVAFLLYAPTQFLDIEIDLKTFRPETFGVPLLLWTLWQIDRRQWTLVAIGLLLTLSVKEDYPLIFAPLGLWIALFGKCAPEEATREQAAPTTARFARWYGVLLILLSAVYLLLAVKVVIPWFKGGQVHYASYFAKFGKTTGEVMINMLTRPGLLWAELVQVRSALYATHLVVPLAGLCLFAPSRLAVGMPMFMLLCLNELAQQPPTPCHHFHAPIVPVLFWAAAAGLGWFSRTTRATPWIDELHLRGTGIGPAPAPRLRAESLSIMAAACCGLTAAVIGLSPLSLKFWEPGQSAYWRNLYVPGERAREFAKVFPLIPRKARVASTDFVHPRFTHHERSYDYSDYVRAVAGFTTSVPADTEYIVIDTRHPYSRIKTPQEVRELRETPDEWELLPDETGGYFIVLRRRESGRTAPGSKP